MVLPPGARFLGADAKKSWYFCTMASRSLHYPLAPASASPLFHGHFPGTAQAAFARPNHHRTATMNPKFLIDRRDVIGGRGQRPPETVRMLPVT